MVFSFYQFSQRKQHQWFYLVYTKFSYMIPTHQHYFAAQKNILTQVLLFSLPDKNFH